MRLSSLPGATCGGNMKNYKTAHSPQVSLGTCQRKSTNDKLDVNDHQAMLDHALLHHIIGKNQQKHSQAAGAS